MLPAQPNQSLLDGLACLQALTMHKEPIGSRELARQLGLDPTRVNRLLKTLAAVGLAEQDENRKYRPGPGIHVLAAQSLFGSGLIRRALGPLESLHRFGFIVAMGVLWRDQMCYLYHAEDAVPLAAGLGKTGLYPAVASGLGMALLAHQPEAEVRRLYAKRTERPLLDGEDGILVRLDQIRTQGYALIRSNDKRGHRTLGIPVGTPPYAAIGLSGHINQRDVPKLVAALREAADQIHGSEGRK
jgi:DNA-binding IclR family transcriptional regulator